LLPVSRCLMERKRDEFWFDCPNSLINHRNSSFKPIKVFSRLY